MPARKVEREVSIRLVLDLPAAVVTVREVLNRVLELDSAALVVPGDNLFAQLVVELPTVGECIVEARARAEGGG